VPAGVLEGTLRAPLRRFRRRIHPAQNRATHADRPTSPGSDFLHFKAGKRPSVSLMAGHIALTGDWLTRAGSDLPAHRRSGKRLPRGAHRPRASPVLAYPISWSLCGCDNLARKVAEQPPWVSLRSPSSRKERESRGCNPGQRERSPLRGLLRPRAASKVPARGHKRASCADYCLCCRKWFPAIAARLRRYVLSVV
jgi:hypothetical protein